MKIIGLGHRKFTGKDTVAKFLCTEYRIKGKGIMVRGFASKLKDIAHQVYSWAGLRPKEYYEDNPVHKQDYLPLINKTVRQTWIEVGMKFRDIYDDSWIDYLLECVSTEILIIPDLRFPNEFAKIKAKGGFCILINRPFIPYTDDVADVALAKCTDWDAVVENDGDLKSLHAKALALGKQFIEGS